MFCRSELFWKPRWKCLVFWFGIFQFKSENVCVKIRWNGSGNAPLISPFIGNKKKDFRLVLLANFLRLEFVPQRVLTDIGHFKKSRKSFFVKVEKKWKKVAATLERIQSFSLFSMNLFRFSANLLSNKHFVQKTLNDKLWREKDQIIDAEKWQNASREKHDFFEGSLL